VAGGISWSKGVFLLTLYVHGPVAHASAEQVEAALNQAPVAVTAQVIPHDSAEIVEGVEETESSVGKPVAADSRPGPDPKLPVPEGWTVGSSAEGSTTAATTEGSTTPAPALGPTGMAEEFVDPREEAVGGPSAEFSPPAEASPVPETPPAPATAPVDTGANVDTQV
jgi:hypothetical protein